MWSSARRAALSDRISPRLLHVYRSTLYRAAGVDIRIGRHVPRALFERLGARDAVLITAWNPLSRRMPLGWNCRMQRQLRQRLRLFAVLDADGSLGRWREAMLLVGGQPQPIIRHAARFRQLGVVVLRRRHKARLCLLTPARIVGAL